MSYYNFDFLIAAMIILLLILYHFLGQRRAKDLNNQVFLFFAALGTMDVAAELLSNYCITSYNSELGMTAWFSTTIFYLFQALLPYTLIFYVHTLHDHNVISIKKILIS